MTLPGTPEERDLRRAQLIGAAFLITIRSDNFLHLMRSRKLPEKANTVLQWFELVRTNTARRERWIWAKEYDNDHEVKLDRLRAEVAGMILLEAVKPGQPNHKAASRWFNPAADLSDVDAWLFAPKVLDEDRWVT